MKTYARLNNTLARSEILLAIDDQLAQAAAESEAVSVYGACVELLIAEENSLQFCVARIIGR